MFDDEYEDEIKTLKRDHSNERGSSQHRVLLGLSAGVLGLLFLCGLVNATFLATGIAIGNVWPFSLPTNNSTPHMIAAYTTNPRVIVEPVLEPPLLYSQSFNGNGLVGWTWFADGWDVSNGVLYGSNTRDDARTTMLYDEGHTWRDYTVEADVTALAAPHASSAQLLFRAGTAGAAARCQLATRGSGQRQLQLITPEGALHGVSFHYLTGDMYRLRATAVGERLSCAVSGQPGVQLSATTGVYQGTVGFQNRLATASFDNLVVRHE